MESNCKLYFYNNNYSCKNQQENTYKNRVIESARSQDLHKGSGCGHRGCYFVFAKTEYGRRAAPTYLA